MLVRGTTAEYRRSLAHIASEDDLAVEIGSAAGVTTVKLARLCRRTVGVDAQESEVAISTAYAEKEGFRTTLEGEEMLSAENQSEASQANSAPPPLDPNKSGSVRRCQDQDREGLSRESPSP